MSQHPVQRPGQAAQEEEVVTVDPVQVRPRGRGHIVFISCSYKYFLCLCQPVLEQLQRRHEAAHQDLRGGARRVLRQVRQLTNGSAAAGHVTRARPLIGCYVAGSPTDHEQCGGGACPLEGGVSSPGEVTVALGGWRDDWLQTVTILHPDTGREVRIDTVV